MVRKLYLGASRIDPCLVTAILSVFSHKFRNTSCFVAPSPRSSTRRHDIEHCPPKLQVQLNQIWCMPCRLAGSIRKQADTPSGSRPYVTCQMDDSYLVGWTRRFVFGLQRLPIVNKNSEPEIWENQLRKRHILLFPIASICLAILHRCRDSRY